MSSHSEERGPRGPYFGSQAACSYRVCIFLSLSLVSKLKASWHWTMKYLRVRSNRSAIRGAVTAYADISSRAPEEDCYVLNKGRRNVKQLTEFAREYPEH